jgi:hypothetical protein
MVATQRASKAPLDPPVCFCLFLLLGAAAAEAATLGGPQTFSGTYENHDCYVDRHYAPTDTQGVSEVIKALQKEVPPQQLKIRAFWR